MSIFKDVLYRSLHKDQKFLAEIEYDFTFIQWVYVDGEYFGCISMSMTGGAVGGIDGFDIGFSRRECPIHCEFSLN